MADIIVSFAKSTPRIALVVRGKLSASHHPHLMAQHADSVLSDGSPLGFYGENNGGSGNGVGLGMQGIVYDYATLRRLRPFYVEVNSAVANRVVSTVLLTSVSVAQARAFTDTWAQMTISPGSFNIVGGNCSTHASAAFISAGVLADGIPGLDTPDNLYSQIVHDVAASSLQSLTGCIGFTPAPSGGYTMIVRPYVDTPAVNTPNPGKSGSLGGKPSS